MDSKIEQNRVREEIASMIDYEIPEREIGEELANLILAVKGLAVLADEQMLGSQISYLLGFHGQFKIYDNYPDFFNEVMGKIEQDMLKAGWRKVIDG